MMTIGGRILEERNRLKLNQSDFGAAGGVGKNTQINYEKGERSPDAEYLAGIASIGADVTYVLTGRRSDAPAIQPEFVKVIDAYRRIEGAGRYAALLVLDALRTLETVPALKLGEREVPAYMVQKQAFQRIPDIRPDPDPSAWVRTAKSLSFGPDTLLSAREWARMVDDAVRLSMQMK